MAKLIILAVSHRDCIHVAWRM